MNILILESEVYLSHSISQKLMDYGYSCTMSSKLDSNIEKNKYDIILLSSSINELSVSFVKSVYDEAIIILLASSVNNTTLTDLLSNGAHDYILKPFVIENLITKIEHYISYERLKIQVNSYVDYFDYLFKNITYENTNQINKFPLFISSNTQISIDAYVYRATDNYQIPLEFISINNSQYMKKIEKLSKNKLAYIMDFYTLKGCEKKKFMESIVDKKIIIANTTGISIENFTVIDIKSLEDIFTVDNFLSTANYTKYMITLHQETMTDVALSKKIGISRKSIWEKRKKYGIVRNKSE